MFIMGRNMEFFGGRFLWGEFSREENFPGGIFREYLASWQGFENAQKL